MLEGRGGGVGKNEQKKDGEECLNWLKKWGKNIYLACSFLLYINIITYIRNIRLLLFITNNALSLS